MRSYPFVTVDVFTERRFGGNQLAVFPDARGLTDAEMQALAAEMNLSETTFVLPPDDPAHTARVRIFNRTYEMPFAGHPNVGTGFVLASEGRDFEGVLLFEELAGLVEVRVERDTRGEPRSAEIDAPQALQVIAELPAEGTAACIGLTPGDLLERTHPPTFASVGVGFVLVEVVGEALARAAPDLSLFRRTAAVHPDIGRRLSILLYSRERDRLRARMFAPLSGTWEDPATGSANAALGALLLSLTDAASATYEIVQGVEMGRESQLRVSARREAGGIRASVAGRCVPVLRGHAQL
jgi:trans-2,3-dihydro-3-hydroxyanthranilate isomerase